MALLKGKTNIHVRILSDNTTMCAYINKFGGKKGDLNEIACELWLWCISNKIHLSAAHIPGYTNDDADKLSRVYKDDLEWSLDQSVFKRIKCVYSEISIDMFASRLNAKLKKYVSFYPDHLANATNAFMLDWSRELLYMFPPFSLIPRILQKVQTDKAEAVLIAPI